MKDQQAPNNLAGAGLWRSLPGAVPLERIWPETLRSVSLDCMQ
jgi:hypothetical protein